MVNKLKNVYECLLIRLSKEFDENYYLQNNPDVQKAKIGALKHFCHYGWKEMRDPSKAFDVKFYLNHYPDVQKAGINPLVHYIRHGKKEGRRTNEKGVILKHHTFLEKLFFLINDAKQKPYLISKLFYELKHNGLKRTIAKTRFFLRKNFSVSEVVVENFQSDADKKIDVVPYYIDPVRGRKITDIEPNISLAVHIYIDNIDVFKAILKDMYPFKSFDLFLSVKEGIEVKKIEKIVRDELNTVQKLGIKSVPSYIDATASLVVSFSKELLAHKFIAHLHTQTDESSALLIEKTGIYSGEILSLMKGDVKFVFAEDNKTYIKDPSGWYGNREKAKAFIENYTDLNIDEFSKIDFPENGMFWAKSASLEKLFKLPLQTKDFREHKDLSNLLKQLLLLFTSSYDGDIYCIYRGDTLKDYRYYEEQKDFSKDIKHKDIKILSYYLGQFHPIPENDAWHGKGFTEWTNVKSAYPLYEGHYQQHIPHKDIGYYMLDNPDILRKQAAMMKKAGVYGQIFYHYWFTGKLILEKPAQMLLENRDIDMPFCFCWANENWTKRWDGNDAEILLGQEYSAEDAREFIRYLIPFFQDSRYIKIDERPVLYVYRPSSIPNPKEYIDIWREECEKVSLKTPYVVAVLTRGALDPADHFMDAGVERILHDWTAGAVPELKNTLKQYHKMTGSVLSYDEVADFYENQEEKKNFTYFRSISPMWDNAARYKEGAFLLDKPKPERFQRWLNKLITYTKDSLSEKERFLIVNAWNEWAEGAHLEPDTYHGYAYLNAIGRALSDMPYEADINISTLFPKGLKIFITMSRTLQRELEKDILLQKQYIKVLVNSTLFNQDFSIYTDTPFLWKKIATVKEELPEEIDIKIELRKAALFEKDVLVKMVASAYAYKDSKIIANCYEKENIYRLTENGSVDAAQLYDAPIIVTAKEENKNVKMRTDTQCFLTSISTGNFDTFPEVTTIIRFHRSANIDELKNALFCLAAMKDVIVKPLITAQDLDKESKKALQTIIADIPFKKDSNVEVVYFNTHNGKGDLRTTMLNEALKSVKTRYVAFLDYDDLLFPEAYAYLIERLQKTGKAVAFGRVYETSYNSEKKLIVKRERKYEYGFSYEDFLGHNHAPLHSFLLDATQLDFSKIVYYEDQKYMEDYLLTLQLFTKENADWESLKDNVYIGDYLHHLDREHTLAFTDDYERKKLLDDPEYQKDDKRISDMRKKVMYYKCKM